MLTARASSWLAIGAAAVAITACREAPVELRHGLGPREPATYRAELVQDMMIDLAGQPVNASREITGRYTIGAEGSVGRGRRRRVRLEALDAAMVTARGRVQFDADALVGREFHLSVPIAGGGPRYAGEVPEVDLGVTLGGGYPVSFLIDDAFPHLPEQPVAVGESWSGTAERTRVEGSLRLTAPITTRYTLAGWETVGGARLAQIIGHSTGEVSGVQTQEGVVWEYLGTTEGSSTWLFDPVSGSVVEMTGVDRSSGTVSDGSISASVEQMTRIHIRRMTIP